MEKIINGAHNMFTFVDGSKIFFTSDTHFYHGNVLKFCNRPFDSIKEMNTALINAWNQKVGENDIVFHLGDFCWGNASQWNTILEQLNGRIYLTLGNHDMKNLPKSSIKYFHSISFQYYVYIENRALYLNHYPFLTWGGIYREEKNQVWQLFGHVHSKNRHDAGLDSSRLEHLLPQQMDVGIDSTKDFTPYSWEEVKTIIVNQIQNHV